MARVSSTQRCRDLIEAAKALILEEGPQAVTARKITERAGASLAAVHYAFRDMDELLHLAHIEVLQGLFDGIFQSVRTDKGLRVLIEDFMHSFWRFLRTDEANALAFFETFISLMRPHRAAGTVDVGQQRLLELMTAAQKHDAEPSRTPIPQLAVLILMAGDGLSLIHLARRDDAATAQELTHLIDALQHLV
jgi:AcrR family transcriptional regulator